MYIVLIMCQASKSFFFFFKKNINLFEPPNNYTKKLLLQLDSQ